MSNSQLSWQEVCHLLQDKLENRERFSVIRCGDGEAMLLDPDMMESKQYKDHVFHRQIGIKFDPSGKEIVEKIIKSYQGADVIGLATPRHNGIGGYWKKTASILSSLIEIEDKALCSIDVSLDFLHNNVYDDLLRNRKKLFYINGVNLDQGFKDKYNIENVKSYVIPPELMFSENRSTMPHYPHHFLKVKEWIDTIDCKGELCLVGGGFLGKIYCDWLRNAGGVVLDAGSVFDRWAGKNTRGANRGSNEPNPEDLIYRL